MSKPHDNSREVGDVLRTARQRLELSQANFALALGISLSHYQRWERAEIPFSFIQSQGEPS